MSRNTHATVGQNQGWVPYARTARSSGNCKMQIAKYKMQIAGFESDSVLPAPCSLLSRRGLSLTEVLIAMGILTVGLLGVASIFPVASFYMQKGDIADRGSAIAQAAFNDAIARGTFDPRNWLMLQDAGSPALVGSFTKPFAEGLRNQLASNASSTALPLAKNQWLNRAYGSAYVIDPLGADSSPMNPSNRLDPRQSRAAQTLPFNLTYGIPSVSSWWPWNYSVSPTNGISYMPKWAMVRLTLSQPSPVPASQAIWPMTTLVADKFFRSGDDLAIDVPTASDRPSKVTMARFDVNNDGKLDAMSRESKGDYSWMATVVPQTVEARNALAFDPSGFDYEVSIVVFYKRILANLNTDPLLSERMTTAKIVSTGLSGGEVLIEAADTGPEPFAALKTGQWVLICGPSPDSTQERPQFVARWYRVLSISSDASGIVTDASKQRLVGLRGPQWPWQPSTDPANLSNYLCCVIVPNVVAVHSKSIHLGGNSSWSVQ